VTLNDLERQKKGVLWIFWRFLATTQVYHSQGGTMLLSLCDPDGEFGICILT